MHGRSAGFRQPDYGHASLTYTLHGDTSTGSQIGDYDEAATRWLLAATDTGAACC